MAFSQPLPTTLTTSSPSFSKEALGQFFTPENIVHQMVGLIQNDGNVLEPACGDGAFLSWLNSDNQSVTGIEIDSALCQDKRVLNMDFFLLPLTHKFDTIIGNPPYIRFSRIPTETKQRLPLNRFDRRSNLYLFFIDKCIDHLDVGGELIFITPREFIKLTSASQLNQRLSTEGCFTYFRDLGDRKVFKEVSPNCAIWRWVKGKDKQKGFQNKPVLLGCESNEPKLGDWFEVKVGAVSGADKIFSKFKGVDFVCSQTRQTGRLKSMLYNTFDERLLPFKDILINRKIRKFDESNWWQWGRGYPKRQGARIYVNCKTRVDEPFFVSEVEDFDGSVLALFPKCEMDIEKTCHYLNQQNWEKLGFKCGGRYLFSQRSLTDAYVSLTL